MPYIEGHPVYYNSTNGNGAQPYPVPPPSAQSHVAMTPEQQRLYYEQQQQQQQMYQMQQQQQHQQQQQQQHMMNHNQFYAHGSHPNFAHSDSTGADGIMYPEQHSEQGGNGEASSQSQANGGAGGGRKMLASLRSGTNRGAALINSMRNISLAGAVQRATGGNQNQQQQQQQKGGNVNDWETRWDEDDDDSDDDADVAAIGPQHAQYPVAAAATTTAVTSIQPVDPMSHQSVNGGIAAGDADAIIGNGHQYTPSKIPIQQAQQYQNHHQQQQQQPPFASPPAALQQSQKPHLVTATPETPGRNDAAVSASASTLVTGHLKQPPATAMSTQDSLQWDSVPEPQTQKDEADEKPNVQMFLPLLRVLGKGSFGKVVLVQKRKGNETGALFAMKILRKAHLVKRRQIERTRTERKVLSVVNHPFIMKLHYAFQSPDRLYLVLDYCPGGELFFHLSRFRRFPERVARFYSAELLLAIGHLHKRGIIYRDLKPENVLLDADGHVKLGDFGLAKAGIKHPCEGATSMCGTPEYMAPEVLSQQGHGFCVDYWGLGMLLYEMMTGLPPWYTTDRAKLFKRLKSAPLDIPRFFSAPAAGCVSALLDRNPRRRLGVTGIRTAMEHEFFRSISWRALYGRRVEAPIRPCEGWSPPDANGNPSSPHGGGNNNVGDLDAATANFDNTFTRMPVETDDHGRDLEEVAEMEELHEGTFLGFTFDDNKDRDDNNAVAGASANNVARERTQNSGSVRHID